MSDETDNVMPLAALDGIGTAPLSEVLSAAEPLVQLERLSWKATERHGPSLGIARGLRRR